MPRRKSNTSRDRLKSSRENTDNKNKINIENIRSSPSSRKRAERKRKARKRKFIRRRIILAVIFLALVFFITNKISNALNSYKVMGYPDFRDEVYEAMGDEVFISPSDGRSLTTAEKITDFDNFYEAIVRNYAVDDLNREDFESFAAEFDEYRKKVYKTKTDQEYFEILNQYLEILDDTRTFILDKETYDSLFNYYRNIDHSPYKEALENPQAVNRYKRLIQGQNTNKGPISLTRERDDVLRIGLADFKADQFDKDLKELTELLVSGPYISTYIIDLRDNNSIDTSYRNRLLEILIHEDYSESDLIYYRGHIFDSTLAGIKESEDGFYSSAHIKNDASKSSEEIDNIKLDDYSYYDQLSLDIKKNTDYSNRNIYVLANENTANEAIKFAQILQKNGAYIVKDGLESGSTYKDVIYNAPSDLYILEHSGLVMSINSAYSKNPEEDRYLNYDQRINSKDPITTILNIIN